MSLSVSPFFPEPRSQLRDLFESVFAFEFCFSPSSSFCTFYSAASSLGHSLKAPGNLIQIQLKMQILGIFYYLMKASWGTERSMKIKVFEFTPNKLYHCLISLFEIWQWEGERRKPHDKDGTKANVAAIKVGQFLMIVYILFPRWELQMTTSTKCCFCLLFKESGTLFLHAQTILFQEQMHFCPDILEIHCQVKIRE